MSLPFARRDFPGSILALLLSLLFLSPLSAASAFRDLARVEAFAFGGIGIAGTTSAGEIAFREILAGPNAAAEFQRLLAKGNPPARCYALAALHALDLPAYREAAARFAKSETPVKTIGGCCIVTLPIRSVVANISAGRYDRAVKPGK